MAALRTLLLWVFFVGAVITAIAILLLLRREDTVGVAEGIEWTCSMHPQIRRTAPGKCPLCGMDLVPVTQLKDEQNRLKERAGIETEAVGHRELFKELRTVGKIDYNERQVAFITSRVAGRVDRVHADFTGIQVKRNDHLVDIYSPDLVVGQTELIRAAAAASKGVADRLETGFALNALEAARTKLSLLGILPEQIEEIEKSRQVQTHLTIYAPIGGTVIEKAIRAGQYVKEGDPLYRIANLDPIWLYLDVYEYDLGWVRFGQKVEVTVEAYPGEHFRGVVTFIDPILEEKTRTVKVRVNLPNVERKLRPGMYASARLLIRLRADGTPEPTGLEGKYVCPMHPEEVHEKAGRCRICGMPLEQIPAARPIRGAAAVTVENHVHLAPAVPKSRSDESKEPEKDHQRTDKKSEVAPAGTVLALRASAVLDTGRHKIAFRRGPAGAFELVELELGVQAEGRDASGRRIAYFPVLKGLKAGDEVVVRGAFLLDSQRQIEGMSSLLYPSGQLRIGEHAGHATPAGAAPGTVPPAAPHKH